MSDCIHGNTMLEQSLKIAALEAKLGDAERALLTTEVALSIAEAETKSGASLLAKATDRINDLEAKLKEAERLGDDLAEIVLLQDAWKNSSQLEEWQAFRSAK